MITIKQKPNIFSPSDNRIQLQIESDNPAITNFKLEILEATSLAVVSNAILTPFPNYTNGSVYDLSRVLSNAVKWEISNSQNHLYMPITRSIFKYKIQITERGIVNGNIADLSSTVVFPETFYLWNAAYFGRIRYRPFNPNVYVIGSTGLPAKFLTFKPDKTTVNEYSSEQLYFLHNNVTYLKIFVTTYSNGVAQTVYGEEISGLSDSEEFMIQVSPKILTDYLLVDFTNIDSYTIHLSDVENRKSEIRTYLYKPLGCGLYPVNFFWINSLGGCDCFQFYNLLESNKIGRNSYTKNNIQLNNGFFTDSVNEVMNPDEEIINVTQQGNYTAHSYYLTDSELEWLNELFVTQQAFQELGDNTLVPIIIENTTFKIEKQRYDRTKPLQTTFDYHVDGEIIPSEAMAYNTGFGNGDIELDFISDQINSN